MNQFTFDCTQLDRWDFVKQPPVPIPSGRSRKPLSESEVSDLDAALRLGEIFHVSPLIKTAKELIGIARPPKPAVTVRPPSKGTLVSSPLVIKFSTSSELTAALAVAASAGAVIGVLGSAGIYASTVREVGVFFTAGAGIFFNSPGAGIGGELTFIAGTPIDFSGPYFGISISAGSGVAGGVTFLFSPTLPLGMPLVLTFMGVAFNVSAVTPTRFPVTVAVEVTDTFIKGVRF